MRKFLTLTDPVHQVHLPRVLVETAVLMGAPREALFENTGLTQEMLSNPDMRISYLQYGMLAANAVRLTGQTGIGMHVGRNTGMAQMGVMGMLLQSSPTLGAALDAGLRYSAVIAPGWDFQLEREGEVARLTVTPRLAMVNTVFAYEVVLTSFDTQARLLTGRELPVRRVFMPFPEPAHSALYREKLYDVPFFFEQSVAAVEFDAAFLDIEVAFADPAMAKLAEEVVVKHLPRDSLREGLDVQVRRLLETATGTPPTLDDLARTLQTSTRSLRRELRSANTSYKELLDASRRVRAEKWIETNTLPIEQLAATLGFSDVRSFRRAFKRWTGRTPAESRVRTH